MIDNEDTLFSLWQNNDENVIGYNLSHPDILDINTRESYLGVRVPSTVGTFSFIAGQISNVNLAIASINSDSLTLHGKVDFPNKTTRLFAQYQNEFFNRKIDVALACMPTIKAGNAVDLAGSLFLLFHWTDNVEAFVYYGRNFFDETYSMQIFELLADNGWLNTSIGNQVNVNSRCFLILDRAKFGLTYSVGQTLKCNWIYENNRNITGANFLLGDTLNINYQSSKNTFDILWAPLLWLHVDTHIELLINDTHMGMSYQRANGYYSSTFSSLLIKGNEIDVSLKPSITIAPNHILSPVFSYSDKKFLIPGSPLVDLTQFFGITYGSKRIDADAGSSIYSAGLSYSRKVSCNQLECSVEFINNDLEGSLSSYDTWSEETDTVALPVRNIKSLQFDISDKIVFFKNYSLLIYASQLLPFYIEYQNAKGEVSPPLTSTNSGANGSTKSVYIALLRFGITFQWEIPQVTRLQI